MFDLGAAIVPRGGAAGVALLDRLADHTAGPPDERLALDWGREVVRYGPLWFRLQDGLVVGVGVGAGYAGLIDGRVGVGSTLAEAARVLGPLDTASGTMFFPPGRPGVGFDRTTPPPGVPDHPDWPCDHPAAAIARIWVWPDVEPWVLF